MILSPKCLSDGKFEIDLLAYQNSKSKLRSGSCCDDLTNIFGCWGDCDNYFEICWRDYPKTSGACRAYNVTKVMGDDKFTFPLGAGVLGTGLSNPLQFHFKGAWQASKCPRTRCTSKFLFHRKRLACKSMSGMTTVDVSSICLVTRIWSIICITTRKKWFRRPRGCWLRWLDFAPFLQCNFASPALSTTTASRATSTANSAIVRWAIILATDLGTRYAFLDGRVRVAHKVYFFVCTHDCTYPLTSLAVCSSGCDPNNGFCTAPFTCRRVVGKTLQIIFFSIFYRCRSGWTGADCKQCVKKTGCSKFLSF